MSGWQPKVRSGFRDTPMLRALPGYPFLPCPICHFTGSCDHTLFERVRASGINFHASPTT